MLEYGTGNNWISTCIIMLKIYRMKWTWWTLNTVVLVDKTLHLDRDRRWGFFVSQKLHVRLCKWRNPTIRNWKLQPFWVFFWTSSQFPCCSLWRGHLWGCGRLLAKEPKHHQLPKLAWERRVILGLVGGVGVQDLLTSILFIRFLINKIVPLSTAFTDKTSYMNRAMMRVNFFYIKNIKKH
jgi:hypothetical protein